MSAFDQLPGVDPPGQGRRPPRFGVEPLTENAESHASAAPDPASLYTQPARMCSSRSRSTAGGNSWEKDDVCRCPHPHQLQAAPPRRRSRGGRRHRRRARSSRASGRRRQGGGAAPDRQRCGARRRRRAPSHGCSMTDPRDRSLCATPVTKSMRPSMLLTTVDWRPAPATLASGERAILRSDSVVPPRPGPCTDVARITIRSGAESPPRHETRKARSPPKALEREYGENGDASSDSSRIARRPWTAAELRWITRRTPATSAARAISTGRSALAPVEVFAGGDRVRCRQSCGVDHDVDPTDHCGQIRVEDRISGSRSDLIRVVALRRQPNARCSDCDDVEILGAQMRDQCRPDEPGRPDDREAQRAEASRGAIPRGCSIGRSGAQDVRGGGDSRGIAARGDKARRRSRRGQVHPQNQGPPRIAAMPRPALRAESPATRIETCTCERPVSVRRWYAWVRWALSTASPRLARRTSADTVSTRQIERGASTVSSGTPANAAAIAVTATKPPSR